MNQKTILYEFNKRYNASWWAVRVKPHGSDFDGKIGRPSSHAGAHGRMVFFTRPAIGLPQSVYILHEHLEIIPPQLMESRILDAAYALYHSGDGLLQAALNRVMFYGEEQDQNTK
jgi:hypothetical protein